MTYSQLLGQTNPEDPIVQLYRQLFGRDPDPQGYQYWNGRTAELGTGNPLRQHMIGSAAPIDATYYGNRNTSEADWGAYRQRAAQQDQGINNMPGVFSDYGSLAGQPPEQVQSILHHDADSLKAAADKWKTIFGGLGALGGNTDQTAKINTGSR